MATDISDRLQPALLDRLTDDGRQGRADGGEDFRVMSKAQLRRAVLRDLTVLFNTVQPSLKMLPTRNEDPLLASSVLNFGLPSLAGNLKLKTDLATLEQDVATAIKRFEPRIRADTLVVRAIAHGSRKRGDHNVIELQIQGQLWSHPVPQEILLRTQLNLEAGQVQISDTTQPHSPTALRGAGS